MGMGLAPTWLRQVSPPLHKTTLTTAGSWPKCDILDRWLNYSFKTLTAQFSHSTLVYYLVQTSSVVLVDGKFQVYWVIDCNVYY